MYKFLPLIITTLSPFIWAFMNSLDKYVISHKVKKPFGFAIVAGLVNLIFGIVFSLFLQWKNISLGSLIFPALAGIMFGVQLVIYYLIIQKEDISKVIGIIYLYPLLVALLSFLFLSEIISLIGYIGMFVTLAGVIMLSTRMPKLRTKLGIFLLISLVFMVAFYEFFVKIATEKIPSFNGLAVSVIVAGFTVLLCLLVKKRRIEFFEEFKNIKYSFLIESFTFLGIATTYFGMSYLPATVFASISAMQPLCVLIFETAFERRFGKMVKDKFSKKLFPICLIILGVILLYINQLR